MDLDERAVEIVKEAEEISKTDLRRALVKMREALVIEPDYPNLEDEIFIREDAIAKLDAVLEFIVVLLREGKDYQACEMLQGLPENYIIQDRSGLVTGLVEKIDGVALRIQEARELAQKDPVKALAIFLEAHEQVADYPGLAENIAALENETTEYESFKEGIEKALWERKAEEATELLNQFQEVYPGDEKIGRYRADIINLGKEIVQTKQQKINFIKICVATGLILAIFGSYFSYEMLVVKKSDRKWQELENLLEAGEYSESRALGMEIRQDLDKVHLFFLGRKQELLTKVEYVLQSEEVIQGAEGNIFFEGKYIPAEKLAGTKLLNKLIEEGKSFAAEGKCTETIPKLEAALRINATNNAVASPDVIGDVKKSLADCRLMIVKTLVDKAVALKTAGSYDEALKGVEAAINKANEYALGDSKGPVAEALSLKLEISRAKAEALVAIADKLYKNGQFDESVDAYRRAASFVEEVELKESKLMGRIAESINKSRVEKVIRYGDALFKSGKWREASTAYQEGISLAKSLDSSNLPVLKRAEKNLAQAEKKEFLAGLEGRDKAAKNSFRSGNFEEAKHTYEEAVKGASGSKWREIKEVKDLLSRFEKGLAETEEKIYVEEKKEALLERYSAVLKRDFGLAKNATLLDPKVVLLKSTPEHLEFSLSAMSYLKEGAQPSYKRYQANYVFDRRSKKWRLTEKIGGTK